MKLAPRCSCVGGSVVELVDEHARCVKCGRPALVEGGAASERSGRSRQARHPAAVALFDLAPRPAHRTAVAAVGRPAGARSSGLGVMSGDQVAQLARGLGRSPRTVADLPGSARLSPSAEREGNPAGVDRRDELGMGDGS